MCGKKLFDYLSGSESPTQTYLLITHDNMAICMCEPRGRPLVIFGVHKNIQLFFTMCYSTNGSAQIISVEPPRRFARHGFLSRIRVEIRQQFGYVASSDSPALLYKLGK